MARFDHSQRLGMIAPDAEIRPPLVLAPAPGIAKPERWQQVKRGRFRSAICDRRANQDVVLGRLGVFNRDVEVAVFAQDTSVPEFELRLHFGALGIAPDQFVVGKLRLRVTIRHPHVGMGRRVVLEEKYFLHILAVISLRTRQTKEAFLEDGIALIPEGESKTEPLFEIRNATNSIFAPAVGAGACVVVREIIPGVAIRAVILPHRAPLPFAQIRPPQMPALFAIVILLETLLFGVHEIRTWMANTLG